MEKYTPEEIKLYIETATILVRTETICNNSGLENIEDNMNSLKKYLQVYKNSIPDEIRELTDPILKISDIEKKVQSI